MLRDHALAALAGVVGAAAVLAAVVAMNAGDVEPPEQALATETSFEVQHRERTPPSRARPPAPRPKPRAAPPPPSALLGALLAGMSFGLDAFSGMGPGDEVAALTGGGGPVVMTEDSVDVAPRPVGRTQPAYPLRARQRGVEGYVTLAVLVGEDGSVRDVQVLQADPPGTFDDAAIEAVRGWTFEPARYQGAPVAVRAQQTLRFTLR